MAADLTTKLAQLVDFITPTIGTGLSISGNTTLTGHLTVEGVTSTGATGTGNLVFSASPTLSGTVGGALTFSGALTLSSALTYGGVTLSNSVTGTGNMVLSASPTLTGITTGVTFSTDGFSNGAGTYEYRLRAGYANNAAGGSGLSAGDPTAAGFNDSAVIYGARTIGMYTGQTLRAVIDASGRLGIGMTPSNILDITSASGVATIGLTAGTSTASSRLKVSNAGGDVFFGIDNSAGGSFGSPYGASIYTSANIPIIFYNNNAERGRFDTSGRLQLSNALIYGGVTLSNSVTGTGSMVLSAAPTLTGTLTAPALTFSGTSSTYATFKWSGSTLGTLTTDGASIFQNTVSGSTYNVVSGGSGGVSLINAATSWSALSRRELKTDFAPITDALERVKAHAAEIGRYKTDPEDVRRAFLFREDAEKYWPFAAHGENELALADFVPLLVKAFQELIFRVERLEA